VTWVPLSDADGWLQSEMSPEFEAFVVMSVGV
jgi:hypothetical protein